MRCTESEEVARLKTELARVNKAHAEMLAAAWESIVAKDCYDDLIKAAKEMLNRCAINSTAAEIDRWQTFIANAQRTKI